MAGVLETCARTLRQNLELQEKARMLTAQSRASAWILGLSPLLFLGAMVVVAPDYVEPLFSTRAGRLVLILAAFLLVVGFWMVRKMSQVED